MKIQAIRALFVLMGLSAFTVYADDVGSSDVDPDQLHMRLLLKGTKILYECEVPPTDKGTTIVPLCHDHDVIDLDTNEIIGTATDALADMEMVGDSFIGTNTVTIRLKNGTFVLREKGGARPVIVGNPTWDGMPITHIASFFPEPGQDNILTEYGTGRFQHATGKWSLLGAIDMSRVMENIASFYCLIEVEMDLNNHNDI